MLQNNRSGGSYPDDDKGSYYPPGNEYVINHIRYENGVQDAGLG